MLEAGNGNMSLDEYRSHMSLWAILAAPLIAGNDLRTMTPEIKAILTRRDVIAINQEPLGRQADRAWKRGDVEVWTKPLSDGAVAVGIFNRGSARQSVSMNWTEIGMQAVPKRIADLWSGTQSDAAPTLSATVVSHGVVLLRVLR